MIKMSASFKTDMTECDCQLQCTDATDAVEMKLLTCLAVTEVSHTCSTCWSQSQDQKNLKHQFLTV